MDNNNYTETNREDFVPGTDEIPVTQVGDEVANGLECIGPYRQRSIRLFRRSV